MLKFKRSRKGRPARNLSIKVGYEMGRFDLEYFGQPLANPLLVKHSAAYRLGYFRAIRAWHEAHPEWDGGA